MNFKSTLFPGVKTMTSTLRVRPPRDRVSSARKKQQSSIFSSKISELNQRITNWRVSPVIAASLMVKTHKVAPSSPDSAVTP